MVLDFAPGATSKLDKILVLGQLGLVGEWRKKLDGDFFYLAGHQVMGGFTPEQNNLSFTFVTCHWC